jgi:Na+-driven multidrug efflux pump
MDPEAQPAVRLGSQVWFLFMMLTLALSDGTMATVSRYWEHEP